MDMLFSVLFLCPTRREELRMEVEGALKGYQNQRERGNTKVNTKAHNEIEKKKEKRTEIS